MSNSATNPELSQSPITILCGPNAHTELDDLTTKLHHVSAMADVLNVAAFAEDVTLPAASFQDYTTDLAGKLGEIQDLIANWVSAKSLQTHCCPGRDL